MLLSLIIIIIFMLLGYVAKSKLNQINLNPYLIKKKENAGRRVCV